MANCKVIAENLSEWFATPQGGYMLAREQAYFDRTVSDIFGYNALQLGFPEHDFLQQPDAVAFQRGESGRERGALDLYRAAV
jgi:hypothetical protein